MTMHKYSDLILRGISPTPSGKHKSVATPPALAKIPQENMYVVEDNPPCHTGGV